MPLIQSLQYICPMLSPHISSWIDLYHNLVREFSGQDANNKCMNVHIVTCGLRLLNVFQLVSLYPYSKTVLDTLYSAALDHEYTLSISSPSQLSSSGHYRDY